MSLIKHSKFQIILGFLLIFMLFITYPSVSEAQTPSLSDDTAEDHEQKESNEPTATPVLSERSQAEVPERSGISNNDVTDTYKRDDLIGAAENLFGKGAKGLADIIQDILKKQGQPNGYIIGREGGGALIFGLRYGSGTLHHKIEGSLPIYWTGPSLGFDAGANAASSFILVYNLHDTGDIFHRFPSGEGAAYFVGGFNASYLRRGDVVLIPVRIGAGLRLGASLGYMKFSRKQRWLPF